MFNRDKFLANGVEITFAMQAVFDIVESCEPCEWIPQFKAAKLEDTVVSMARFQRMIDLLEAINDELDNLS